MTTAHNTYKKTEEILNVISHGIGAILSVVALIVLIVNAWPKGNLLHFFIYLIYGISLVILYFSSTLYHAVQNPKWRNPLNVWDHISIYLLIAGSYGPFSIIAMQGRTIAWVIFIIVWAFALVGIILKLFFFGKYNILSAIAYVVMGWIAVIGIGTMLETMPLAEIYWLFGGGVAYTLGAVIFMFDEKIPYNHAIFHFLVLIGSACHFYAVYTYLLMG